MGENDLKEFDMILTLCDSKDQCKRIDGRLKYAKFSERFTKGELDEMFKVIKDWWFEWVMM